MSRPNRPGIEDLLSRHKGFMLRQSLSRLGVSCRDRMFLCHDRMFLCRNRVGNGGEALCHNRIFYVPIECGQMERFCVAPRNFMSRQSLVMGGASHVAT